MKTFCQNCGQKTKKYQTNCSNCGTRLSVPNIPSYVGTSVAAMIFLFLPTGIVALINSLKVNNKIKEGNFEEAVKYSKRALMWCWISFPIIVSYIILRFFVFNK